MVRSSRENCFRVPCETGFRTAVVLNLVGRGVSANEVSSGVVPKRSETDATVVAGDSRKIV